MNQRLYLETRKGVRSRQLHAKLRKDLGEDDSQTVLPKDDLPIETPTKRAFQRVLLYYICS